MKQGKNISIIVAAKLCNTCGACAAVCRAHAIEFRELTNGYCVPVVHQERCNYCGLCLKVCGGHIFGKTIEMMLPADPFVGNCISSFVGKATNEDIYRNSQSGGVVTALLVDMLNRGRIDGAVVVVMEAGNPPRPRPLIARTAEQILDAQKSKYCPVPILEVFSARDEGNDRLAVVALPCQVHSLYNMMDYMPALRNRIQVIIGLMCDRVMTYSALDYLIYQAGMNNGHNTFYYRDKTCRGYPGDVNIKAQSGRQMILPYQRRLEIKNYFTPVRCRLCFDKMNIFADITVGDPHGLKDVDRSRGETALIVRTPLGMDVINIAVNRMAVALKNIDLTDITQGQNVIKKKINWRGLSETWKDMGFVLPEYFNRVQNYAKYNKCLAYKKDLELSLELASLTSMDEILKFVDNKLRKSKYKKLLSYPIALIMRAKNKFKHRLFFGH